MTKSFNKFKKPYFGPFSHILGQKKFPWKSVSVTHNFIWVFSTKPKFRKKKLTIQLQENVQTDRRTDRLYFIGSFQGSIKILMVNHLVLASCHFQLRKKWCLQIFYSIKKWIMLEIVGRVRLNWPWFVIQDRILNYHNWILLSWAYSQQDKKIKINGIINGSVTFN